MPVKQTNLFRTPRLTREQKQQIADLVRACSRCDQSTLSFPAEEGDLFYLHYTEKGELACAAALSFFGDVSHSEEGADGGYAECSAFTLPALRRLGYFSSLFDFLSSDIETIDLYFVTEPANQNTQKALASLGAVHDRDEYLMEIEVGREQKSGFLPECSRLSVTAAEEEGSVLLQFYLKESPFPNRRAGSCRLFPSGDSACFYGFEIETSLRGRGLGREALLLTLSLLADKNCGFSCRRMYLHVSGTNLPAVSLYKKTGFCICKTLSYYLY